jgi:diadenosine tetraphosphatase ApaH/serine/threonine PP2A family protein phosphatase
MRVAILADIHANLAALQAVLDDIKGKGGVDEMWCLGDIVGYGPDPRECIEAVEKLCKVCVAGNHDYGAVGKADLAYFNPAAADACRWTAQAITPAGARYLESLPTSVREGDFLLVHGSPMDPVMEYIFSTGIAEKNFNFYESRFCLAGHTHVPMAFKQAEGVVTSVSLGAGIGLVLGDHRMIINPGAVGQPRDGDPRAAYAIYDSEGNIFRVFRIPYNIQATQNKMMKAGLPINLITRLEAGK